MPAIRSNKKHNPFVMIDKEAIQNPKLSFRAKGMLAYMLSLPDNWIFHEEELAKHSPDGKHIIRQIIKELTNAGHIQKRPIRHKGKITRWETVVTERSQPDSDFPQCGKSDTNNNDYVLKKKKEELYTPLAKLREGNKSLSFTSWNQITTGDTSQHDADDFILTYATAYQEHLHKPHPAVNNQTISKIRQQYQSWIITIGYKDLDHTIIRWFNDPSIISNYHIAHFSAYVTGMEKRIHHNGEHP